MRPRYFIYNYMGMTGEQFRDLRQGLDLSLRELADRWGVDKRTIHREERKLEVRGLYADAIRRVQREFESDSE